MQKQFDIRRLIEEKMHIKQILKLVECMVVSCNMCEKQVRETQLAS